MKLCYFFLIYPKILLLLIFKLLYLNSQNFKLKNSISVFIKKKKKKFNKNY